MLRNYQAARELERVRNLSAFDVQGATRRKRVNQHATRYAFADGSIMQIRTTAGWGEAWHPDWTGSESDVHLGPVHGVPVQVNDLASYVAWREQAIDDSLAGRGDHTLTFMQRALWLQTGECPALLS